MSEDSKLLDKVSALAKRRGFIYQGSEIYGGLAGTWDYGPLGVELKRRIKDLWWKMFVTDRSDMFGLDAAILMQGRVWEASGHTEGFADPLVACADCHHNFRADQLENPKVCPDCRGVLGEARSFDMMFSTKVGAAETAQISYLRPETAQGIFVNFKNVVDSFHPKLPFGIGQIGKAFRNEIAPRDFIFRTREFEQMEVEYFIKPETWEDNFEKWRELIWRWTEAIGLSKEKVHELEVPEDERAHYSKQTIDFEFDYPFGRKELYGLAYRTNYDLSRHQEFSKRDLSYYDEETKERLIPHVIEPSLGVDRTVLAVLLSSYREDDPPAGVGGEMRAYLALPKDLAPFRVAVFPLLKNKPDLVGKARSLFSELQKKIDNVAFDDNGNIGKRYRRQDEIGTPYCVTADFQSLEDETVTVRDRDTGEQERVAISELAQKLS